LRYVQLDPKRVWETRLADKGSREIFFVTVCRSLGVAAWMDPVTRVVKYIDNNDNLVYDVDKEDIQKGYILKCGPGYALPSMDDSETWNPKKNNTNYLPLQVKPGDLAIFLQKGATEIKYNGEKYYIVPQNAILLVERDDFE
jgi:co-chaperonin GroES (HSP10)